MNTTIFKRIFYLANLLLVFSVSFFIIFSVIIFPTKYSSFVEDAAKRTSVDRGIIYAVIKCESGFNKNAVSKKGAKGLMQLMPSTFIFSLSLMQDEVNIENKKNIVKILKIQSDIFDPQTNILAGSYYLKYLVKKFGNVTDAVMAYNAGEANVSRWIIERGKGGGNSIFEETKKYIKRVTLSRQVYDYWLKRTS